MLPFFRNIRWRHAADNQLLKYSRYAVGEIVLVVVGILIALSINNWNERQKDLIKEQKILAQLQSEYKSNLTQLDEKILMRNEALEACDRLLHQIDNPEVIDEENLYTSLWQIVRDPTFDPIKNDIVGSENLRLIQNEQLVRILSNWSSEVYQVQELELEFQKFRTANIIPCYNRLGISRNVNNSQWENGYTPLEALDKKYSYTFTIKPTRKDLDLKEVLADVELEGIVSQVITFHLVTNLQSRALRNRINDMLEIIEQEMDDK